MLGLPFASPGGKAGERGSTYQLVDQEHDGLVIRMTSEHKIAMTMYNVEHNDTFLKCNIKKKKKEIKT